MVTKLFNIRIEKNKLERFKNIAQTRGATCTELITEKIDDILLDGSDMKADEKVRGIIKELRAPFTFVKTKRGRAFAKQERKARALVIQKLRSSFDV